MKKSIVIVVAIVAAAVVCTISFLLGDKHGVEHMSVASATPTDLAQTMLEDEFYSTYRESTIVMTGKIAAISRTQSQAVVEFPTTSMYKTRCSFNAAMPSLQDGQTITILTEGASAQRQSAAVLLVNCIRVK